MTADPQIERALPAILADLGSGPAPDYEDRVLAEVARVGQRPSWSFPKRWLAIDPLRPGLLPVRMQPVVALVLLLAALITGAVAWAGAHPRVPAPFGLAGNGLLVFGRNGDIVVGRADGTLQPVVIGGDFDFGPFFSPDGTKIAFLRRAGRDAQFQADLMVVNPDGTGLHRVTARPLNEVPWTTVWSPDSRSIFVVTTARADVVLETFDAARAGDATIVDTHGLRPDGVAFQPPDGRRILFRGQHDYEIGLYLLDLRDGTMTVVVPPYRSERTQDSSIWSPSIAASASVAELRNPAFSPDGSQVVYHQNAPGHWTSQLFLARADGTVISRALTTIQRESSDPLDGGSMDSPVFSPDGTRIAFRRFDPDAESWRYGVLRPDDLSMAITGPPVPDGLAALVWSPDGTRLIAIEHSGDQRVLELDPNGANDDGIDAWHELPWTVETDSWWISQGRINGFDAGTWQRVVRP
jgi:WD40-like Beta Propeller Repeat